MKFISFCGTTQNVCSHVDTEFVSTLNVETSQLTYYHDEHWIRV